MQVPSLGQEDLLEKEMATHSRVLAWRIPWTEESGGLQSMGSQKSQTQLSAKEQQSLTKHGIWERKEILPASSPRWWSPIPFLKKGQAVGLCSSRGVVWHISVATTEDIEGLIPGNADLGRHLSLFSCQVLHILTDFPAFWILETGRAHPHSKSGNCHIFAFLVSFAERTWGHKLASKSQTQSYQTELEAKDIEK